MKVILFLILFSLCFSDPLSLLLSERRRKTNERIKKIKDCIKQKGSESFKKLMFDYENKNMTLGKIIKVNEDRISVDDLKVFHNCRKQIYQLYKKKFVIKHKRP